jgi:tRNA-2-methylthio-N6-dimethylallyladenosine synthase
MLPSARLGKSRVGRGAGAGRSVLPPKTFKLLGEIGLPSAQVNRDFHLATTYHVTTFGCQMNAHDSERIKGMLEELGLGEAPTQAEADVVVFNTCTIREKPDTKFAAHMGDAAARKRERPELVIAVGGCYAEAQRERLFSLYPAVDVAFGPGTIPHLGEWLGAGGSGVRRGVWGTADERTFAAALPLHGERRFQAWVQISMGCNSKCSYCIVPAVRGREVSRRPGDVLAEVTELARRGVREVTLLGQNVNSWGRDLLPEIRTEFGELLRACDEVDGIERIRFTSPHPKDFRAPVIEAMAECAAVCEHAHLPLQSGSTRILKAMRRTYSRERYLKLVGEMRAAIPDLALTTDIIVGFPGETEDDFRETLEVVDEVGFDGAFTFVYSPRAGTDAAAMAEQIPDDVKRDRIERLVELVQRNAARRNEQRIGRVEEVLVEGPSRTDPSVVRGRTRRNTTVNFSGDAAPGDFVDVLVERATSTTLGGSQVAVAAA